MNILASAFLSFGLLFGTASPVQADEVSELTSEEVSTTEEESASEVVTDETGGNEDEGSIIEKWINGEDVEIDEETLIKIYDKLSPITEEQVNKALEKYIEDADQRSKVSFIIMGVFVAFGLALEILIFLKKNTKTNNQAKINSDTISASSEQIKSDVSSLKDQYKAIDEKTANMEEKDALFQEATEKSMATIKTSLKSVLAILQIVYGNGNGDDTDNGKDESEKV